MAGLPPFGGFFAKLYIFTAAIESGLLHVAIAGVIFSVVSAFYYLKIIKTMYFNDSTEDLNSNLDKKQLLIILGSALLMILFLMYAEPLVLFINYIYNQ